MGTLTCGFFVNKHTVGPSYPRVWHPRIQPATDRKQYFRSLIGSLQMQRADCMHRSTPFSVQGLGIGGLGGDPGPYPSWVLRDCR